MNKAHFFELLKHPDELNKETLQSLTEIVAEYPWFQAARMLMIKNLHLLDHVKYNSELKLAAAHISDRTRLFNLINNPAQVIVSDDEASVESKKAEEKETVEEALVTEVVKEKEEESAHSSVGISTKVKSISDYFQTSDIYQTDDGTGLDFSLKGKKQDAQEGAGNEQFSYETAKLPGYILPEEVSYHEVKEENKSFSDWLNMLQHTSVNSEVPKEEEKPKKKSQQIIDNFLNIERPRIVPAVKSEGKNTSISEQIESATSESEDLMSETLAGIYIRQKHYSKAISIFEKLRLKYPEKNTYFADRISEIEKLINHQ